MLRIITTRDAGPWAFDDVIVTFPACEWHAACNRLEHLRRVWGPFFRLLADPTPTALLETLT